MPNTKAYLTDLQGVQKPEFKNSSKGVGCSFRLVGCISVLFFTVIVCSSIVLYMFMIHREVSNIPPCVQTSKVPYSSDHLLACNGQKELCAKPYNFVAFATMHNAFATTQEGFLVAQHRGCMRSALVLGMRAFMLDLHLTHSGEMKICHFSCAIGWVSLKVTLDIFKDFMTLNPREIVTIFWEPGFDMKKDVTHALLFEWDDLFGAAIIESQINLLLPRVLYVDVWPSLSTMIEKGERLVMFSGLYSPRTMQGVNHMKYSIFQTQFSAIDKPHLTHACDKVNGILRPSDLLVVNQFTRLSTLGVNSASTEWLGQGFLDLDFFKNVNREPYFSERVVACARMHNKFPTFVVVDFWEDSDIFIVVDKLNNGSLGL